MKLLALSLCFFILGLSCRTVATQNVMVEVTPVDPTVTYGSIVTLNCSYDVINNTANLTIEWTTTASNMDLSSVSMAGDTSSMLTLSNVDLSHSGNYTCDVVNDDTNTTEGTDSIVLTVNPPAPNNISISPPSPSVEYNNNITITCQVTSLTSPNITWTTTAGIPNQGALISQGNIYTRDLVLNGVTLESIGSYTCTATNEGGTATADAMLNVTVPAPSVSIPNDSVNITYGMDLTLNCTVSSVFLPITLEWRFGQTVIKTMNYSTAPTGPLQVSIANVNQSNAGVYTCVATHDHGTDTDNVNVTVYIPPPSGLTIAPTSLSVNHSDTVTFDCTVTSLTTPNITWSTTATAGITNQPDLLTSSQGSNMYTSSLVLNGVTLESIGSYTCTATNEGGTATAGAMLNVTVPAPSGISISPPSPSVEYNKNITFNCTVTSLTTPNITWTTTTTAGITSDVLTSSQGSNMYTSSLVLNGVTLESIGSYTCTATNEGGTTTATAMLNVTVPAPSVSIPNDSVNITYGMDLTLNCTVSSVFLPITAEWRFGQTVIKTMNYSTAPTGPLQVSIANVTQSNAGVYTCVATHDHGTDTDNVNVIVYIPPPSGLTIAPTSLSVNHSDTATFNCTVTSLTTPNITWTTTATAGIPSQPDVLTSSQGSNMYTSSLVLNGVTLESIGSYTCTATNEGGTATATAMLNVEVPTSGVFLTPASLIVNYNRTLQLNCTVSSVTPPTINWTTTANVTIPSDSIVVMSISNVMYKSVLTINNVNLSYTGRYTCSSTNQGGSESDDSDVTVVLPVPTVSLPSDISVTYDDSLSITCNVTSLMRPSSIIWYHNDTMISSEAQPSFTATGVLDTYTSVLVRNDVVLNDSGVYRCEAQNMAGRGNDSVTVSVTVPLPVILDLDDLNVTIGLNVTLNCTASGFGLRYKWDPRPCGNGCTPEGFDSPLLSLGPVLFGSAGEYVCNVTDFIGQKVTKIITITPLGPTLLSSNVSNCRVTMRGVGCTENCGASPIQVINGTNEFLQCSFQNRPDAPYNLTIFWYIGGQGFGSSFAKDANTIVTTTPEDEDRIVTTTMSFNPVNYTNFISSVYNQRAYYCSAFIGYFLNDPVDSNGTCLEVLFGPVFEREPERNSRVNLGERFIFLCDSVFSNPKPNLRVFKTLLNGSELTLSDRQADLRSISNATYDDAGTYTCVLSNDYGRSERSFELIVQSVPDQVTNVSGSLISFFDIYISWSVPSSNFGLNQRYNVEYRLLVDSVNPSNVSAPVSSYKLTDATPNNNYTVIVSSVNDVGRGPLSNSFTIPSISSDMASLLRVRIPSIFITSTEIQVFWGLPPLFRPAGQRPAIIDRFSLTYKATNGGSDQHLPIRNDSLNHTINSLTPSTEYSINVNVEYGSPNGLKGNPVNVIIKTKPADNLPEVSTNITSSNINDTTNPSVLVKWQPLSPEDGSDFLQRYVVRVNVTDLAASRGSRKRRQTNPAMMSLEYNISDTATQFDFTEIKPFMSYSIGVNAALLVDGVEREVPITRPAVVDSPESTPGAPTNFRYTELNFTYVELAWDPPGTPNGIVTHYQVDWESGGKSGMIGDIPSERRSTRVVGLTGNVRYTFKVKARTSVGFGAEAEFTNSTYAGVAPFGAPTLVENTEYSDRLNILVGQFFSNYGPLSIYKVIVVTSPSVNGPFPESTLHSYSNNAWKQYQYYVTALHYDEMQNTTLTIGTGSIYSFEGEGGARYFDAPLEAGTSYRVFIRLYSSISDAENPYRDSPLSNTIEISTPVNLAYILVPVFIVIFLIILAIIAIIVICFVCNKRQARKQESFYLEEISKTEASMKQSSNGSQRTLSTTVTAKATSPEGRAAGLYTPTLSVNNSSVYTSTGQPTLLMCESGGTPAPVISWHKEGMIIEEPDYVLFNDGSLYITNTKLKDQGHFIVRATNSVGVVEESVRVTVVAPSPPESDPNHPPLNVSDFIEMMALLQSNNSDRLEEEYPDIELEWNFTSYAAKLPINHSKNRYVNIIPYDHSRVTLKPDGTPGSDYINASFIGGIYSPKDYIATQGPIPAAFPDFWRMIWEYNVPTIIMVTNLKEDDKIKCHQYWPSFGAANYGSFQVTLKEVETVADYAIRTFQLQSLHGQGPIKEVRQYHFLVWPDHGVPQYATPLLSFQKRVRNYHKGKGGPMVVHCSAGVGRTGTFITIDTMIMKIDAEGVVDVFNFVRGMRFNRNYMVQTASQYDFLHHAILEAIMCRDTTIPAVHMSTKIAALKEIVPSSGKTGLQSQFETLESSSPTDDDFDCSIAQLSDNLAKSRMKEHLPPNDYRVVLSTKNYDSDYICASYVDGYRQRSAFIATQGPMKNTAGDFWRMVWEMKSMIIIMLTNTEENGEEQSVQYWPVNPNEEEMYGSFNVVALPEDRTLPDYIVRKFKLSHSNNPDESRTITHFQYVNWPSTSCPDEATSMIDLVADVVRIQRKSGNGPITVHCSDGLGRTGTFCAMFTVLERLKAEQVIDVFSTVKTLRIQRPGFINDIDQYEFIHKAALEFVNTFDNYDNFKY